MMDYVFSGKVHPERANVNIAPITAKLELPDPFHVSGVLEYSIVLSQVSATFRANDEVKEIPTLKNVVEEIVRVALDALGYILGCGYDLEITHMADPQGGRPVVFGVDIPAVRTSASEAGVSMDMIMKTFADARGRYLMAALSDLREAIRAPKDTSFFCYRAIESLRQYFADVRKSKDAASSWVALREELGIDRADIDTITALATPVRHGRVSAVADAKRAELFKMTWDVVNRYIQYADAGYKRI